MKSKIFGLSALSILVLVLFMSLGSATNVFPVDVSGSESTINHGESIIVTFKINNIGIDNVTNFKASLPDLFFGEELEGNWESAKYGNTLYIIKGTEVNFSGMKILNGIVSDVFTLVFNSQQNDAAPGTYTGPIDFSGEYESSGNSIEIDPLTLSITVSEDKSLLIKDAIIQTGEKSTTLAIKNDGNVDLTNINLLKLSGDDFDVEFNPQIISSLTAGQSATIQVTMTTDPDDLILGEYSVVINATTNEGARVIPGKIIYNKQFYEGANEGKLKVRNIDFYVEEGFGDSNEFWYPLDSIRVKIELKNDGKWDIDDIEIEACLFDEEADECIMDEDDMDLSDNKFDLRDGERKTINILFDVNPGDLEVGNEVYTFYIKAVGEIDDSDKGEFDEDKTGVSTLEKVEIRNEEFIILDNFQYSATVQCGENVQILADVWNVGDTKIDEDEIFIHVYEDELGINKVIELTKDISELDYEMIDFILDIPQDAEEKTYRVEFSVYDDEDLTSDDVYENSEDDEAIFSIFLKVEGNCILPKALVSASLDEGGKAGKELIVRATIKNTGSESASYLVNAVGYAEWASLISVEPSTITLQAGQSADVLITLDINKEVSGDRLFNIDVLSEGELVVSQPLLVEDIKKAPLGDLFGDNGVLTALIIGIALILVIIIIILAVRVARK